MLTMGPKLRAATITAYAIVSFACSDEGGDAMRFFFESISSSKQASAGTMVSQFRNERLPLTMRTTWKITKHTPAMRRVFRGPNTRSGAASSTKWLNNTPIVWTHGGAWWRSHDTGLGFGCVS